MYYIYVAIFGALGAGSRYWINCAFPAGTFPFHTLLINIAGCFLLAVTVRYLSTLPNLTKNLINGIGTGFLGSFTTFSTFSFEASQMIAGGEGFAAAAYIFSSIAGGFLSALLGFSISSQMIRRKELRNNDDQ